MSDKWGVRPRVGGGIVVVFYDPNLQPLTTVEMDRDAADEFRDAIANALFMPADTHRADGQR